MKPRFRISETLNVLDPVFDEEPEPRKWLLAGFLTDFDRQEELVLGELDKAEAGETILDVYNNYVHLYLYPDLVVIEDMWDPNLEEDEAEGPRRCTFLTLQEATQLILDWLEAKQRWYETHPQAE